jgi:hypothetical protein
VKTIPVLGHRRTQTVSCIAGNSRTKIPSGISGREIGAVSARLGTWPRSVPRKSDLGIIMLDKSRNCGKMVAASPGCWGLIVASEVLLQFLL